MTMAFKPFFTGQDRQWPPKRIVTGLTLQNRLSETFRSDQLAVASTFFPVSSTKVGEQDFRLFVILKGQSVLFLLWGLGSCRTKTPYELVAEWGLEPGTPVPRLSPVLVVSPMVMVQGRDTVMI